MGWVGEIKNKEHLSPDEAEIGAELGKNVMPGVISLLTHLCDFVNFDVD